MNAIERFQNAADNIKYLGFGLGLIETIFENINDDCDQFEKNMNAAADNISKTADDLLNLGVAFRERISPDESYSGTEMLKYGDIIAAPRDFYWHYAVYIGDNRVIHFAPDTDDFGSDITIHEAPFDDFLRDAKTFDVLEFGKERGSIKRFKGNFINGFLMPFTFDYVFITDFFRNKHYHLYSPEETVARAKMVAKEYQTMDKFERFLKGKGYNVLSNNCEHFALWCKTGVHESRQVDKVLREMNNWPKGIYPYMFM